MPSCKLHPVMSLGGRVALWVMLAPGFEKKSLGVACVGIKKRRYFWFCCFDFDHLCLKLSIMSP